MRVFSTAIRPPRCRYAEMRRPGGRQKQEHYLTGGLPSTTKAFLLRCRSECHDCRAPSIHGQMCVGASSPRILHLLKRANPRLVMSELPRQWSQRVEGQNGHGPPSPVIGAVVSGPIPLPTYRWGGTWQGQSQAGPSRRLLVCPLVAAGALS